MSSTAIYRSNLYDRQLSAYPSASHIFSRLHIKYRLIFWIWQIIGVRVCVYSFYKQTKDSVTDSKIGIGLIFILTPRDSTEEQIKNLISWMNFIRSNIYVCAVHSSRRCFGLDWSAFIRINGSKFKNEAKEMNRNKKPNAAK